MSVVDISRLLTICGLQCQYLSAYCQEIPLPASFRKNLNSNCISLPKSPYDEFHAAGYCALSVFIRQHFCFLEHCSHTSQHHDLLVVNTRQWHSCWRSLFLRPGSRHHSRGYIKRSMLHTLGIIMSWSVFRFEIQFIYMFPVFQTFFRASVLH